MRYPYWPKYFPMAPRLVFSVPPFELSSKLPFSAIHYLHVDNNLKAVSICSLFKWMLSSALGNSTQVISSHRSGACSEENSSGIETVSD